MSMEPLARAIAIKAHQGQFRRDGVTPYIAHPAAVASRLTDDTAKAVGWLHDVLEDTDITVADLYSSGLTVDVIDSVRTLTKGGGRYEDYLLFVKIHPLSRRVKIADILHNISDKPTDRQIVKYAKALLFLMNH